jgi:c-di-GMP-binding flagellar brake protein YcgR
MPIFPLAIDPGYRPILDHVRLPEASPATVWWIVITIFCTILVFMLFELIARFARKRREVRRSKANFEQLALVCQLEAEEIKLLRQLVSFCEIQFPDRLFTSFELFNRCLGEKGTLSSGFLSELDVKRLRIIRNRIFFGERRKEPPIKSTRELRPNQWLQLKRVADGDVFMARVVEAAQSGLLVSTPRSKDKNLGISPGERFDIYFWRDRDASYHFETHAIGQSAMHLLITIFEHVEDVERIQRRQFHRTVTSIPVVVIPVAREELDRAESKEVSHSDEGHPGIHGYIVNISGSGFTLAVRTALRSNDLVYMELPCEGDDSKIPVIGKILNVTWRKMTEEFLVHAEFVGVDADTHEKIFQLIYSQMRREAPPLG